LNGCINTTTKLGPCYVWCPYTHLQDNPDQTYTVIVCEFDDHLPTTHDFYRGLMATENFGKLGYKDRSKEEL